MDRNRIRYLLERYEYNYVSMEEVEEMLESVKLLQSDEVLSEFITEVEEENLESELPQENWDRMWMIIKLAITGVLLSNALINIDS